MKNIIKSKNLQNKVFEKSQGSKNLILKYTESSIYKEKPVTHQKIDPMVDQDEVEYLKTIGNLHWFLYP